MIEHRSHIEFQVPFFDVDSMQIAWHGHYAKYFEMARCQLLEDIGHDYDAMKASGFSWPVVDLRIRYMRPLTFKQWVRVAATLKRWDAQLRIAYRVRDRDSGASLARGATLQVPVKIATGERHSRTPEAVRAALARLAEPPQYEPPR
ncbi:acyl-CoA thioesterase [Salinisphaera sp.]|uniref:acyl-CoA thioesterase n=1 Tax=Salinisphaera sp. TaxID=1914330 RepID=UPI002D782C2D|nr:acyl-CoA thioesterase [Salinisphaera sp.]HET7315694.1 acyl-CoA thioesterase [Salinisphaera sp.]